MCYFLGLQFWDSFSYLDLFYIYFHLFFLPAWDYMATYMSSFNGPPLFSGLQLDLLSMHLSVDG